MKVVGGCLAFMSVLALWASGCIQPDAPLPPQPAWSQPVDVLASGGYAFGGARLELNSAARGVDESVIKVRMTGPAHSWVFVHLPFLPAANRMAFSYHYTMEAVNADAPGDRLAVLPHLVRDDGNGGRFDPVLVRTVEAGTDQRAQAPWNGSGIVDVDARSYHEGYPEGFVFAYAATEAWVMTVSLHLRAENPFGRADVRGGSDLEVQRFTAQPAIGFKAPVNRVEGTVMIASPGWTHVGAPEGAAPHAGRHELALHFPNGMDAHGLRDSTLWDEAEPHAGTLVNTPGELAYRAQWADVGLSGSLLLFHMPWESPPNEAGGLSLIYCARLVC